MGKKTTGTTKLTGRGPRRRRVKNWRPAFLRKLSQTHHVGKACEHVRVSRASAYAMRETDADFATAWDAIINERVAVLEDSMFQRATRGVRKPVWQGGKLMGTVYLPSDQLAVHLSRSWAPDRYNLGPGDGAASSVSARQTALEIRQALQEMEAAAAPAAVGGIAGEPTPREPGDEASPAQQGSTPSANGGGGIQADGPP